MKAMALAAATILGVAAQPASAAATIVGGSANPFLAAQPDGTNCCSGDAAPGQSPALAPIALTAGHILTFTANGAVSNVGGSPSGTPDGDSPLDMAADYGTGISGALGVNLNGLVGVFVADGVPGGAAPAQLASGTSFAALAPGLNQIFWIGDGLTGTGSGSLQQFTVPTGATRLFLGSSDGFGWANNSGSFAVTITDAVPEPASWAMLVGGFGLAGGALRRRPRSTAASA